MNKNKEIAAYLKPGCHVHLVGIGGVSMRPLGLVLKGMGMEVSGSDMSASVSTDELIAHGIHVDIGHSAKNIAGADCIIRTAAAHNDNPEIAAARAEGIPVFERAQAWGEIMKSYKNAICISGTHGKTTTTSMMTHILMEAGKDPTVMIGGYLPLLHAGHRVGHGDTIVLESCEYCDSFLNFFPTLAVVLNVEADHLDYFKDLTDIQKSFHKFAGMASDAVVANGDDPHTVQALEGIPYVSFGLGESNRVRAENISDDWRHFDVLCDGKFYCHMDLGVLGRHNTMNALAVAATSWVMGIPGQKVTDGVKGMGDHRIVLAFQPHTYTRTKLLMDDFIRELQKADVVVLAEIYAARESNTIGISSADLAAQIPGSIYCETLQDVTDCLRSIVREGDIVLTMGAGDIFRAGEALLSGEDSKK